MIALIDYGAGNLTSVRKALAAVNCEVTVPGTVDELTAASGIIVPGVGHFDLLQNGLALLGLRRTRADGGRNSHVHQFSKGHGILL